MTLSALGIFSAAGAGVVAAGDYQLIRTEILTGTQASVTFSNLGDFASTYRHLQLRILMRSDTSGASANQSVLTLNGNTSTSSYAMHQIFGNGSSVGAEGISSGSLGGIAPTLRHPTSTGTSNVFAGGVIDILDAYSTTKNKVIRVLQGVQQSESSVRLSSGVFLSTASITSIGFAVQSGNGSYVAGCRFSLYGIRG